MKENYLLATKAAQTLYFEVAKDLPILDFHNHLSPKEILEDRRYETITELWLTPDPYKHRLMRICGVPEFFITGSASDFEKFEKFCEIFPFLAGNPVYDWSRMELSFVFGVDVLPSKETARYLYDLFQEKLASPEFSCRGILSRFSIEYLAPVATITDSLSVFDGTRVAPSLRGDQLLEPTKELIDEISKLSGVAISDTASYTRAVGVMLERFYKVGCRFADHALDASFFAEDSDGRKRELLVLLGKEYAKRSMTLLLHIGAKRDTSSRLRTLAGPAGGYAGVGEGFSLSLLADTLRAMEENKGLPDTVIFPLNQSDQAPIAALQGSFSQDHVASKVQLGPAWWWCDHAFGIENTLKSISSFGVLSAFIGMTTDSRSILSFVRHDYFRRLFCSYLARENETGQWEMPLGVQKEIVRKVCYQNAKDKISRGE